MLLHSCYHHAVLVNTFQMCLRSCLHILDAVNNHVWFFVPFPPPLCEIVNISLLTIDLTCLVDSKCMSKLICSDLCCVHLQVISVVRLHQTQLQGLYYCLLAVPSLLDWSSCIQRRISYQPVNKKFLTGPYGQFTYRYMLEC